jgi:hypothetical protein
MIEKISLVAAAVSVTLAASPTVSLNFANGCAVAHGAAGTYTITLDQPLALAECMPTVSLVNTTGEAAFATIAPPTNGGATWVVTVSAVIGGAGSDVPTGTLAVMFESIGNAGLAV